MCDVLGLSVVRLKRIRLGFLDLNNTTTGCYRHLTTGEINRLKKNR
jgi:23S rRNA pseudouridine2605 synthase